MESASLFLRVHNFSMPFTPEYRSKVESILSQIVPIRTKAMFGGLGIYSDDLFFALIDDDRLYFKVDDANRADFEAKGMCAFVPFPGSKPMGYWELPDIVLNDSRELAIWIDKALGVANRAKSSKKR